MAIFSYTEGFIKRSLGMSALAAAAYISRSSLLNYVTGSRSDFRFKGGLLHSEILVPSGSPEWVFKMAQDREVFWSSIEDIEKRKDSQLAFNMTVALPHELDLAPLIELMRLFLAENYLRKGLVVDFAIHSPSDKGDKKNIHAHALSTTRQIDAHTFGRKITRTWYSREQLKERRLNWANCTNLYLERNGLDIRLDSRSYKDRGIDKVPTKHLGAKIMGLERRGIETTLGKRHKEIEARNKGLLPEVHTLPNQVKVVNPLGHEINLSEFLDTLPLPPIDTKITWDDVENNPALNKEYWELSIKNDARHSALSHIIEGYQSNHKIMATDLCALSNEDIMGLKNNGVEYLDTLIRNREQSRKRDTGRGR
jgi:hypothetical protein